MTEISPALLDLGIAPPERPAPEELPDAANPAIMVGPYTMRLNSALKLMVTAILKAHDEDRPFDDRDFTALGFTDEQIRTLGPKAWALAANRRPGVRSYYEVSR